MYVCLTSYLNFTSELIRDSNLLIRKRKIFELGEIDKKKRLIYLIYIQTVISLCNLNKKKANYLDQQLLRMEYLRSGLSIP
jgi:hypothetical protein